MSHSGLISCPQQIFPFHNPGTQRCTVECLSVSCCTNHLKQVKVDCLLSFSRSHWGEMQIMCKPHKVYSDVYVPVDEKKKTTKKQQTHRPTVLSFPIIKPCWEFTLSENSLLQIARLTTPPAKQSQTFQQSILSGCREPHPSIRTAGCCYSSASVRAPLYAHRHPRALTSWLCFAPRAAGGTAELSPEGGGGGADEISINRSHLPLLPFSSSSSSSSSSHTLHPNPSLFLPSSFSEVSGDSGPCYLAPPFCGGEEERGRKREAAAHYQHVPRGPLPACLPACLPLLLLSTAVAQHQTLTSWDLNPAREPREESLTVCESSSPLFSLTLH